MGSVVRGGADLFFDDVSFLETIISRGRQARRSANDGKKEDVKPPDLPKHLTCDRFSSDYPEPGSLKVKKPDNRLTLTEFLGCLVRISFLRANPKHGQYDNKAKLVELPGCLKKMVEEVIIPKCVAASASAVGLA